MSGINGKLYCEFCNAVMDELSEVDYECPNCGATAEWNSEEGEFEFYEYDENDYSENDSYEKPECCRTCGGNYPDCIDSCEIFDD